MSDMLIPEETWRKVSRYCDELRELNAELLDALRRAKPWIDPHTGIGANNLLDHVRELIAKAEALK